MCITTNGIGGEMKGDFQYTVQIEREKLNHMVDEALTRRIPISKSDDIQKQSRFLEQLIEQAKQAEKAE
jgi:uncharacterized protein (DUF2344 family)